VPGVTRAPPLRVLPTIRRMDLRGARDADVEVVRLFLAERFGDDVRNVSYLASGEWSRCFAFRLGDSDKVVRFGLHLEDFEKDRLAAARASPGLPIPAVMEIGTYADGFYAVSDRIFGVPLHTLDPDGWRTVLPSVLSTLDAVREADISGTSGFGLCGADGGGSHQTWHDYLLSAGEDARGRRIDGWRRRLKDSPIGASAFEESLGVLRDLAGYCPETRHLIHCDLQLNMFVSGSRVTGLIDWGCSLFGDFLYDHAYLAYWDFWYPATAGIDFAAESAKHLKSVGADLENFEQRMRCYRIHIGLEGQAYTAFVGRWDELAVITDRTLAIARGERPR
jgi:hygromycin-B 4-O-kinase